MASQMGVKKSATVLLFLLVLTTGCLIWLFYSGGEVQSKVNCIVDKAKQMQDDYPDLYGDLATGDGEKTFDNMKQYGTLFLIFTVTPGAFIILWLTLVVVCACQTENGKGYYCAKTFILLSNIFIVLGIAFYAAVAALKIAIDNGGVIDARDQLDQNCDDQRASLEDARDSIPASMTQEREQIDAQLDISETVCGCATGLIDNIAHLFFPSITCSAFLLITFIWVQCLCCHMGCCKNAGKKEEPVKMDGVQFARP